MLTIDALRNFGADVDSGLARCFQNEALYLKLVGMGLSDGHFDSLDQALREGDLKAGFEAAHALKGVLANLSLTPLLEPVSALTELLRGRDNAESVDTDALLAELGEQLKKARALL